MGAIDTLTEIRLFGSDCVHAYLHAESVLKSSGAFVRSKLFEMGLTLGACVLKSNISSCSGSFWTCLVGVESS